MHFRCVLAIVLLAASSVAARAGGEVIGDSLGVGVGWASKLPSHAKISVSIQSGAILEQLRQAHRGDTVFMSLGTNDAVGGALNVKSKVDAIVKTADELGVKLVWMGPPCVYKPWESQSQKLDGILREELAGTSVTYVSMRSDGLCDRSVRAPDGVHFSMTGYDRMWRKAAGAAGFETAVAEAEEPKAANRVYNVHKKPRHAWTRNQKSHLMAARSQPNKAAN
jgi:hypothetical protein